MAWWLHWRVFHTLIACFSVSDLGAFASSESHPSLLPAHVAADRGGRFEYLQGQLELMEVPLHISPTSGHSICADNSTPAVSLRESAVYSTVVGGTAMVQTASTMVSFPAPHQPQMCQGSGYLMTGDILVCSSIECPTAMLSCYHFLHVITDMLHSRFGSLNHQRKSCWKTFQCFMIYSVAYISQEVGFQFLSISCYEPSATYCNGVCCSLESPISLQLSSLLGPLVVGPFLERTLPSASSCPFSEAIPVITEGSQPFFFPSFPHPPYPCLFFTISSRRPCFLWHRPQECELCRTGCCIFLRQAPNLLLLPQDSSQK